MINLLPLALAIGPVAVAPATPGSVTPVVVPAQDGSMTVAGVTLPGSVEVDGHTLVLNGVGLRKKSIIKVYVGGLYLPSKQSSADQILAADAPRRMVLQFLRNVGRDNMCNAWDESLKNNTPDASPELRRQFAQLCDWMEDIKHGEQFVFTYVPGKGTEVEVAGKVKGVIAGKDFADALFRSWIGPKPAPGTGFKQSVLGWKG
ncbi:MAG: chalcone isomerase family protein [Gemmatimonadota bacterium]